MVVGWVVGEGIHIFKLINDSFFLSFFHSFMYRGYIEGNHHSKNGKE